MNYKRYEKMREKTDIIGGKKIVLKIQTYCLYMFSISAQYPPKKDEKACHDMMIISPWHIGLQSFCQSQFVDRCGHT